MDVQREGCGTLTVKTDEEWMRTRTRKETLTLEDSDFIEAMDDAFKETYSPRGQVAQQSLHFLGVRQLEQPRDSQLASHHHQHAPARSYSPPSPSPFPLVLVKKHEKRMEQTMPGFEHGHP